VPSYKTPTAQFQPVELPLRWPLVTPVVTRGRPNTTGQIGKDAQLINCYAELDPITKEYWVEKRPGLSTAITTLDGGVAGNSGRGLYLYQTSIGTGFLYEICGGKLYMDEVFLANVGGSTATYHFVQVPNAAGDTVFGDATYTYYTNGTIVTAITDPDFPTLLVPGIVYLDGTIYVMTMKGAIYGSAIDDPSSWDALNKIVANLESDPAVFLTRQLSYVVALKRWTTNIFYDAGNASGSPLSPVQGGFINQGCYSADTVQSIDGALIWMAVSKTLAPQIVLMENLKIKPVSTPDIDRLLLHMLSPVAEFKSFCFAQGGHRFYCLSSRTSSVSIPTLVYDIDQQLWYFWTDVFTSQIWPIAHVGVNSYGRQTFQHETNGKLFTGGADYTYATDEGVVIPVDIYTPNWDAGVDRVKQLNMMRINADQASAAGATLQVSFSDDDYQNWSSFRTVDLYDKRPILPNHGSFYRRAYHFSYNNPSPFRMKSVDLQMDIGTL
jgi:hypothetical protein